MQRLLGCVHALCAAILGLWLTTHVLAQHRPEDEFSNAKEQLKLFLQQYLRDPRAERDETTRFAAASVQLSNRGAGGLIVYVTGGSWCGSGGWTTMIPTRTATSVQVVTGMTNLLPAISCIMCTLY